MPAHLFAALAALAVGGFPADLSGAPGSWNGEQRTLPAEECAVIAAAIPVLARTPNGFRRRLEISASALPTWRIAMDYRPTGLDRPSDAADLRSCRAAVRATKALGWRLNPITETQRQAHDVRPLHWISRADLYAREGRAAVWLDDKIAANLTRSERGTWIADAQEPLGDPLE
jgi:hypothetical protein